MPLDNNLVLVLFAVTEVKSKLRTFKQQIEVILVMDVGHQTERHDVLNSLVNLFVFAFRRMDFLFEVWAWVTKCQCNQVQTIEVGIFFMVYLLQETCQSGLLIKTNIVFVVVS